MMVNGVVVLHPLHYLSCIVAAFVGGVLIGALIWAF